MLYILNIIEDTIVDGPGLRTSIYGAGCPHSCPGCHNPQSWNKKNGKLIDINTIMKIINRNPIANVTFSGGEPFSQVDGFIELAKRIKIETNKTIWCYTGYRHEELMLHPKYKELLSYIDTLIDGPFIQDLRDENLKFRGSSNQRIIELSNFRKKIISLQL